jgi:hypothetical protein
MHIHQSIVDKDGENLFSDRRPARRPPLFYAFIAGQQTYLPAIMAILAPYVNSYRRIAKDSGAPVNTQWGYDNRTCGLRVPPSDPANRRLENRIPSSDANPYLAIAAALAAGYLGMTQPEAQRPGRHRRQHRGHRTAAQPAESLAVRGRHAAGRDPGPTFCQAYDHGETGRVRDLHAHDQPVGAGVPAAECLSRAPLTCPLRTASRVFPHRGKRARRVRPPPPRRDGGEAARWGPPTATPPPPGTPLPDAPWADVARADVCIVGAGYTGLGAALELARRGVSVVVLEAAQVGSRRHRPQRRAGPYRPARDQAWLEKTVGRDDALALWRLARTPAPTARP